MIMKHRWLGVVGAVLSTVLVGQTGRAADAQTQRGPYARIAILRPLDGHTVDFEAGYIRHLESHRQARDTWAWYGWSVTFSERQRRFIYASFGHSAASFDNVVAPAEDERDNLLNVAPHVEWKGTRFTSTCRVSRVARASRRQAPGPSSPRWSFSPEQQRLSRQP